MGAYGGPRLPTRRSRRELAPARARATAALLGGLAAAAWLSSPGAYVPGGPAPGAAEVAPRRGLLAAACLGALAPAALRGADPAFAEDAPKAAPKPPRPPENLEVSGGKPEYKIINGRWTIAFGKKINDKAVYKKDGQKLYLMFNDCGEFQFADVAKGECEGLGQQKAGVWTFGGVADPGVKVQPIGKKDMVASQRDREDPSKLQTMIDREQILLQAEGSVNTFLGNMDKDQDEGAKKLMNKLGAKMSEGALGKPV